VTVPGTKTTKTESEKSLKNKAKVRNLVKAREKVSLKKKAKVKDKAKVKVREKDLVKVKEKENLVQTVVELEVRVVKTLVVNHHTDLTDKTHQKMVTL
jgi:hypothetical protein